MALTDLLNRVKQSRLGQAVSNLDRDREKPGFQIVRGGIREGINRVSQLRPKDLNVLSPTSMKAASQAGQYIDRRVFQPLKALSATENPSTRLDDVGRFIGNFGSNFAQMGSSALSDVSSYGDIAKDPIRKIPQTVRGVGKTLNLINPVTQGANAISSGGQLDQNDRFRRFSSGYLRGISLDQNLATNVPSRETKFNLPVAGEVGVDPVQQVGSMVGFVKNPVNKQFFNLTNKLIPTAHNTVKAYIATTMARGGIEDVFLSLPELPKGDSVEKANYILTNLGQGAVSELIGTSVIKGGQFSLNKLSDIKIGDTTLSKEVVSKLSGAYDELLDFKRKMSVPVKTSEYNEATGERIVRPMWQIWLKNQSGSVGGDSPDILKGDIKSGDVVDPKTGNIVNADPTEALKAEARKYKSADEFVTGKQVSDYWSKELGVRPGDEDMLKLAEKSGPYRLVDIKVKDIIDKDKDLAREIANNKSMTNLLTSDSSDKAVIIDKDGVLDGYHRIADKYKNNPEATIKAYVSTKSQLTDIYNQAKVDQPASQISKLQDTLKPEKVESSRVRLQSKLDKKSKLRTFQEQKPVQGGSKLQVKPGQKVKAVSDSSSDISISRDKKYAFNINKKKLGLNEQQSKELDNVVETMRPVLEKNKGETLTKQEIIEGGRKAKVLEDVMGRDESKQFAESLQASRNLLRSQQSQAGITPEFLDQLEIVSSHAADAGRRLQAFNIGAEDITIKEKVLRDLLKMEVDANEILEAGRKVDWNNAEEVTNFYRKFKPATLADKLDEFRYTNMLSSPNTHIVNTFSNFLQTAVLAPIEKSLKGMISFAEARLTGKEQEYFARQGVDYFNGYWKALPEAWDNLKKTISGIETLTKPDIDRIPTSTSKLRQLYTTPLRALEASDQFFRTLVKGGETESLKRQGITGAKAAKIAEQEADYRTFRQAFDPNGELGQNKVLQIWDKWNVAIQNLREVPGGKWLVPFLQTPTNILKQGFEYSPLGVTTVKGASDPMGQLAKSMIGTSVFTGAYALANSGLVTWDTPTNSTERSEFYAAGLQPYSVKVGDKWISYSKLGPLSYPIAMAAALKWAKDNGGEDDDLATIGQTIGGTLGFFADQSYVRGIGDIIDAVRGDEYKQSRALSNIPAQLVPYRSFMGWVARMVDPVYRKTSGGSILDQVGKSLVSQIPFASKSLEAYQTPFGTDSQRQLPVLNAFSPASVTQERPEERVYYDTMSGLRKDERKADQLIKQIEEGAGVDNVDTSKLPTDLSTKVIKKKLEAQAAGANITVTPKELEQVYLSKEISMPQSNRYEKSMRDSKLWSKAGTIIDDEDLSDAQKQVLKEKIASELGRPVEDLETYQVAKQNNDTKTLYAYDQIDTFKTNDEFMRFLVQGRKPINGEIIIADGVIDNLVNDGIISEQLGKELKNLDLNEDGTVKKKKSKGGSSSKTRTAYNNYFKALAKVGSNSSRTKIKGVKVGDINFSLGL